MENNEVGALMSGGYTPAWIVAIFTTIVGRYMTATYDAIAYASDGARATYECFEGVSTIPSAVIANLPARPTLDQVNLQDRPRDLVYVGRLEERKGVAHLLAAWSEVEQRPEFDGRLVLIGDGPLDDLVTNWSRQNTARRHAIGPMDHSEAIRLIARCAVLVLPSIRSGRWREQIGLPIHEALLTGTTVVTTDETGLATWLAERGHIVISASEISSSLTPAILTALSSPIQPSEVVATLPESDGRVDANKWLHGHR